MICPNCNTTNLENATTCYKCGASLMNGGVNTMNVPNMPVQPMKANNEPVNKKKTNWQIPVLILIVVILIIAIGINVPYFLKKKHDYGYSESHQDTSYAYSENGIPKFITGHVVNQTFFKKHK